MRLSRIASCSIMSRAVVLASAVVDCCSSLWKDSVKWDDDCSWIDFTCCGETWQNSEVWHNECLWTSSTD